MILAFFPDSYIALNREVAEHPKLVELLQNQEANEFEVRLAQIAAYCDVMLDDYYIPSDLEAIAELLWKRLRDKRGAIYISTAPSSSIQ